MQRRTEGVKRERISVSLDADDYAFVQSVTGGSDSHRVAKIITAARLACLNVESESTNPQIVEEFVDWLATKKSQSARELYKLLSEFLNR